MKGTEGFSAPCHVSIDVKECVKLRREVRSDPEQPQVLSLKSPGVPSGTGYSICRPSCPNSARQSFAGLTRLRATESGVSPSLSSAKGSAFFDSISRTHSILPFGLRQNQRGGYVEFVSYEQVSHGG